MENQDHLAGLHAEHAGWQNQIQHFKGELKSMKDELGIIVSKLAPRDVPSNAEHFQNQFILQRDVLDVMRHDFKQYENQIESAQRSKGNAPEQLLQVRDAYQVRLTDYDKLYRELKNEFENFKKADVVPA